MKEFTFELDYALSVTIPAGDKDEAQQILRSKMFRVSLETSRPGSGWQQFKERDMVSGKREWKLIS